MSRPQLHEAIRRQFRIMSALMQAVAAPRLLKPWQRRIVNEEARKLRRRTKGRRP